MENTRMQWNRANRCRTLGAALLIVALGGCAAGAPGAVADPTARQEANSEKQKQLKEMERIGQRN